MSTKKRPHGRLQTPGQDERALIRFISQIKPWTNGQPDGHCVRKPWLPTEEGSHEVPSTYQEDVFQAGHCWLERLPTLSPQTLL